MKQTPIVQTKIFAGYDENEVELKANRFLIDIAEENVVEVKHQTKVTSNIPGIFRVFHMVKITFRVVINIPNV